MDIQSYRQYMVNTDGGTNRKWTVEYKTVHPSWRDTDLRTTNHPLVNSNKAYWTNKTTLCTGYKMLGAEHIFRPIFSHRYQRMIDEFQPDIARGVNKRDEKMAYLEMARIKKLPIDMIGEIISWAY